MMVILLYLFFLIPLVFINYWVFHSFLFLLLLIIFFKYFSFFFCLISYFFGLDYISFWLIVLTLMISCLMFISFNLNMNYNLIYFSFFSLFLSLVLVLVFCSLNLLYMYMFFELSLFPLLIIIFGWGYQPERLVSGLYLFFYTLFASLPLLILIIYFYLSFSCFFDLLNSISVSFLFYFSSIFAFLVKFPMFMFHFWLPKAHVQAPVFGSMVLAAVLLKLGGYGIIRFMSLIENGYYLYSYILYSFCLVGCLIVSLVCFIQGDLKSLIANSSVSHMMMCIMGLLSMFKFGFSGSFLMMISHGFCSSGLFFVSSISYDRIFSRSFYVMKGFMLVNCSVSFFWFLLCCFNMGCPPSINFISELMIMVSVIFYWSLSFLFLIFISFFTACFSFYLFSYSYHGVYYNTYLYFLISVREYLIMFIHSFYMFIMILFLSFIMI